MIYRCLVADDNLIDRDLILKFLSKIKHLHVVAVCADGNEAADVLAKEQIDIVFSDIDMPDLSGFGLKRGLNNPPVFVFITSHAEYAVESFNLDVVDFIVKPLTFERFFKAVNKATEYIELKKAVVKNSKNYSLTAENGLDDYFFIKETQGITKLKYADVRYIESLGDYSKIYTETDKHVTLVSLKNLEKQLPVSTFMRVHKQYIINLQHVITITANEVHLSDKLVVPVSTVSRQELIDMVVNDKILTRSVV